MKFSDYQKHAMKFDRTESASDIERPERGLMITLLGLAGETGSLLSEYKKWLREGDSYRPFSHQVSEELGDILWYLASLASKLNLDLGEVAEENLAKIEERWSPKRQNDSGLFQSSAHRFDSGYKENEQLPISMRVELLEDETGGNRKLRLRYHGQFIGDDLTDNSHINDGYRYHDVFHIACAVLLGWSPVMRRILRCKRKSQPSIDDVEDGARALVTEEAVSALVFSHARDYSMFENSTTIDYDVLRTIRALVAPFEVKVCSLAEWERMILDTFVVWRQLIEHKGGTVVADFVTKTIKFEPLQPAP